MRTSLLLMAFALPGALSGQARTVYRIPVTGVIETGLAAYVARALEKANATGGAAVILDINTEGGRVDAAEQIVDAVRASALPVYAFVNPRAYSAGAMIALAAKGGIYMVPGGVVGAATPVDGQGTKAPEKIVSAMRAAFRALAESNGLDPKVAEGMVDETIEIPGLKPAGKLLTLSTSEAVKVGYAKAEVTGLPALLSAVGLTGMPTEAIALNWAEQVVRFFTHPLVSPLLLSLGMLGLIFEIKHGAFGLGGIISLASLGLFFGSSMLLGLAGWEELILLGLGLVALAIEVFALPGFGVAGVLGMVMIGASMILAMVGSAPNAADFVQAGAMLAGALLITGLVFFAWIRHLPNSSRFGGLLLKSATHRAEGFISSPLREDLIGKSGKALTDLRPAGVVQIDGERLDVVTEGEFIRAASVVTVIRSDGYRLVVREAEALQPSRS